MALGILGWVLGERLEASLCMAFKGPAWEILGRHRLFVAFQKGSQNKTKYTNNMSLCSRPNVITSFSCSELNGCEWTRVEGGAGRVEGGAGCWARYWIILGP